MSLLIFVTIFIVFLFLDILFNFVAKCLSSTIKNIRYISTNEKFPAKPVIEFKTLEKMETKFTELKTSDISKISLIGEFAK